MPPTTSGVEWRRWRSIATLFLLSSVAFTQIRSGTILGVVSDPSGAPVVGAEVRVVETQRSC
jgi:hypothetical protein